MFAQKAAQEFRSVALSGLGFLITLNQGRRAPLRYALAPGYLLPRLRRWLRGPLDQKFFGVSSSHAPLSR